MLTLTLLKVSLTLYCVFKAKTIDTRIPTLSYQAILDQMSSNQRNLSIYLKTFLEYDTIDAYERFKENNQDPKYKRKFHTRHIEILNLHHIVKELLKKYDRDVGSFIPFHQSNDSKQEWNEKVEELIGFALIKIIEVLPLSGNPKFKKENFKLTLTSCKDSNTFLLQHFDISRRSNKIKDAVAVSDHI